MQTAIDTISYITPDGSEYVLDPLRDGHILSAEGEGMPPIEYITQQGPFQHGVTPLDYFLQPRTLQYIVRKNHCSRAAYWQGRASLLDLIRPNRAPVTTLGKLRRYRADGTVRQIDAVIVQGPGFTPPAQSDWDAWSYQEALRFQAFDPTWYDPVQKSIAFQGANGTQLQFPVTFPIQFNATFVYTATLNYAGSWLSYPTIVITGPLQNPTITNQTTGESIELAYTILAGKTVTLDLRYGYKTVTQGDGTNLVGYITPTSDLATFHVHTAPEAPKGNNTLIISGIGGSAATSVAIYWYVRYIGI